MMKMNNMKRSKTLIFIFSVCAIVWLHEMGSLLLVDGYAMRWFDQVMSAFTSVLAMITWIFEELDR